MQREFEVTPAGTLHRREIELRHLLVEGESLKKTEINRQADQKLIDAQVGRGIFTGQISKFISTNCFVDY